MSVEKIQNLAELLLDIGKRNKLINFTSTRNGDVEVVLPEFSDFFDKVIHGSKFEVFNPNAEEEDEDLPGGQPKEYVSESGSQSRSGSKEKVDRSHLIAKYGEKLKKGQCLVYNSRNKHVSLLEEIRKKAQLAMEETGINISYLAFGQIVWSESEGSDQWFKAPLLLVPVSIEKATATDPHCIVATDEEVIVNPAFSFKMQQEWGLKLPEFDEDAGVDAYFEQVSRLASKMKWFVVRTCKFGLFSFQKISMYQDLKDNAEEIQENQNVLAVFGEGGGLSGGIEGGVGGEGDSKPIDFMDLHTVVDADSSQVEAIELAKKGRSFVLQGPPGTGKSQTITNVIAECLADGKTVLFVSEKLAALNVVFEKLKKANLDEFCLELHSHKASKRQVTDNLYRTLIKDKSELSGRAKSELEERKKAQESLDNYVKELHKVQPVINKTLYEIFDAYSAQRKAPHVDLVIPEITKKDEEYGKSAKILFERYVGFTSDIGYDYRKNVWYGFSSGDNSYQMEVQLKEDLNALRDVCVALQRVAHTEKSEFGISIENIEQAKSYQRFFAFVKKTSFITPALLSCENPVQILERVKELKVLADGFLSGKKVLDEVYSEGVYELDGKTLYNRLTKKHSGSFRIFSSEYREIVHTLKRCKENGKSPKYDEAVAQMDQLRRCQQFRKKFLSLEDGISSLLGRRYKGVDTDFEAVLAEVKELGDIQSLSVSYGNLCSLSEQEFLSKQKTFEALANALAEALTLHYEARHRLEDQFNSVYNLEKFEFLTLLDKCDRCLQNIDFVRGWLTFTRHLEEMRKFGVKDFLDRILDCSVDVELIPATFLKAFYAQWADSVLRSSSVLGELMRIPHDEAVRVFKEKDELNFEINKAKIRMEVSSKRPNVDIVVPGSPAQLLRSEGQKKRKQKSIRPLLSALGEWVFSLKPCFLMSPLSVSTFLAPDMKFDVVIFDEASQVFPQDAIGAIYRGKQLIVVGDSKQMPPSNFFNASSDMEDEDMDDITAYESILDRCSATFPQKRLKWHYRSRYESLISFSNKNFYQNELISFPSPKEEAPGCGVDYFYVDGFFDRDSKTNRAEAERVVELVFEHAEKRPHRSLGVVAFSVAQQSLIEKLIAKRRQQDPSKETFFRSDCLEPFFVKNLETVQGDERDTIIFSVAYGKDAMGRIFMNFGPLNKNGGERRLNVAVTRAKYNVQLVTSMHSGDIDLSRTQAEGSRLLREYLDYAENGMEALERTVHVSSFDRYDSEFELEVCEFLRSQGYDVDTQVGCSSFKIDMALKQPGTSNYLLAIECDGASYHSSKSARDRDRLRQAILESMGWRFYRIWSTDWFNNKAKEKERLLKAVQDAIENVSSVPSEDSYERQSFEQIAEKHCTFPKYQLANIPRHTQGRSDILTIVKSILEVEAPVSEVWILRRLAFFYGRQKVTSVVQESFNYDMRNCSRIGILRRNGFLYLQGEEIPMLRVPVDRESAREVKHIAIEELANGMLELLKQNGSAEISGLFHSITQHLGFCRMGPSITERLEEVLKSIQSKVRIEGDSVFLE